MPVDPRLGALAVGTGDPLAQITQELADLRRRLDALERSGGGPPAWARGSGGAQSLTSGVETAIPLDSTWSKTQQMTVAGTRITVGMAGLYLITSNIEFAANGTGYRSTRLRQSGSIIIAGDNRLTVGAGDVTRISLTAFRPLAAGDYIEALCMQTSGGALALVDDGPGTIPIRQLTVTFLGSV